jgi:type IV pilus assembly protein PilM
MDIDIFSTKPDAFGIDISDFSLKIAYLKKKKDDLKLISFGEQKIPSGIIQKGEVKNENRLAEVIKSALSRVKGKKIRTKYVISSLPEEKSFIDVIQIPLLEEEEIKNMISFEIENHIPFQLDEVYFDFEVVRPSSNKQKYREVLIAAIPKEIVDSYNNAFHKAKLQPLAFEIESFAIVRALIRRGEIKKPLLIIDFGRTRTTFMIYSGTSLRFTSTVPFSSQMLTEILAKQLKISSQEAERVKLKEGLEGDKKVAKILTAHLKKLINEINSHLDYYKSHEVKEQILRNGKRAEKVLLCGGGANLKGLPEFISSFLKTDVELGNPWVNILKSPLKEVPGLPYRKSLSYTTALGLALANFYD